MNEQRNSNSLHQMAMPEWLRERMTRHAVFTPGQLCDLLESWLAADELPQDINRDEIREVQQRLLRGFPALASRKRPDFEMPPPGVIQGEPPEPDESEPGRIGIQELMGPEEGRDPEPEEHEESPEPADAKPDSVEEEPDEVGPADDPDEESTTDDDDHDKQDNRVDRNKGEG